MNKFKYILLSIIFISLGLLVSCNDDKVDDEVTDLNLSAVLTPHKLETRLSNITELQLTWEGWKNANEYEVQIFRVATPAEGETLPVIEEGSLPVIEGKVVDRLFTATLQGSSYYVARVRALSETINPSNWASIAIKTGFRSIIQPVQAGDIDINTLVVRFTPNSSATRLVVADNTGTIKEIALAKGSAEIVAGMVTIEGLMSDTEYTIKLYNETVLVGETKMSTLIEGATEVAPGDNLQTILDAAEAGDVFLLRPGVYNFGTTEEPTSVLTINKSVVLMGKKGEEPTIQAAIVVMSDAGNTSLTLDNVILDGQGTLDNVIELKTLTQDYGVIKITNSQVKDYKKGLVSASNKELKVMVAGIVIDNSIFTNILCDGSEAIDFRFSYLQSLEIANSTFNNVAPSRMFLRLDNDAATSFPGRTSNVNISHSTFYKVTDTASQKGLLYVRFISNSISFTNNLVVKSEGFFSNEKTTSAIAYDKNIYYEAPTYLSGKVHVDADGKVENPEFEDAAAGNFTLGNTAITAGDPRWIK